MMKKIAFYIDNKHIDKISLDHPEKGNPGVGGTEYMIHAISYYLSKESNYKIILGATSTKGISNKITTIKVKTIEELINEDTDFIIFKYELIDYLRISECLSKSNRKTKLIVWAHNFIKRSELSRLAKDKYVKRIICVSQEQLNMYRDHLAFKKSSYIYNGMPISAVNEQKDSLPKFKERDNEVTYIGSIVPYKGFLVLAKAWSKVLDKYPDAKLNVIGSGKLYDRNSILGKYGIAEESYENLFMKYLTDDKGKVLPSVTFHGILGAEKNDILKRTKVGVPNPSGVSETFCITALEMQAMGCLVTTLNYGGFKNTVFKTGILYNSTDELADSIIKLLEEKDNKIEEFYRFMDDNFSFEKITNDWIRMLDNINNDIITIPTICKESDRITKLKEINRKIKEKLPFGYILLPTIDFYISILRRLNIIHG